MAAWDRNPAAAEMWTFIENAVPSLWSTIDPSSIRGFACLLQRTNQITPLSMVTVWPACSASLTRAALPFVRPAMSASVIFLAMAYNFSTKLVTPHQVGVPLTGGLTV